MQVKLVGAFLTHIILKIRLNPDFHQKIGDKSGHDVVLEKYFILPVCNLKIMIIPYFYIKG